MAHLLETFLIPMLVFLASITHQSEAAATSKGDLLKFYPISPQQYSSIVNLINQQQPAIHEGRVLNDGHRSIAEWSNSLPGGWDNIFDMSRYTDDAAVGKDVNGYPLCVLKANASAVRRKRGGRQYHYDYAGVTPSVVYTGAPSPYPEYTQYAPPVYGPGQLTTTPVLSMQNAGGNAVVNCVVVLRRNKEKTTTTTTSTTRKPGVFLPHPGYPYPPPFYGYPGAPPNGYPLYGGGQQAPHSVPPATLRQYDANSLALDPNAQLAFQAMLNEYYQQLAKLYMANSVVQDGRGWAGAGDLERGASESAEVVEIAEDANYYDDDNDEGEYDDDEDVVNDDADVQGDNEEDDDDNSN